MEFNENKITLLLSAVAGFTDTAGFIALNGLFTTHVTGNFVLAGVSLLNSRPSDALLRLAMLPVFIVVVSISFIITSKLKLAYPKSLYWFLIIQSIFLLLFALIPSCFELLECSLTNSWAFFLTGSLGVTAMAIQNAYMRILLPTNAPTTVMTGNLTQFALNFTELIYYHLPFSSKKISIEDKKKLDNKLISLGFAILGFLIGAACGALAVSKIGLICCIIPALILFYLSNTLKYAKYGNNRKK